MHLEKFKKIYVAGYFWSLGDKKALSPVRASWEF